MESFYVAVVAAERRESMSKLALIFVAVLVLPLVTWRSAEHA